MTGSSGGAKPRPLGRGKVIFGLLFSILGVEAIVRLPATTRATPARSVIEKAAWLARTPAVPVLVVGDSSGHRGIEIQSFSEGIGQPALNGCITSGSPIIVRELLSRSGARPKQVVFAFTPVIFSDHWPTEPQEAEVASLRERALLLGAGEGVLGALWATYRYRQILRSALIGLARPRQSAEIEDRFGALAIHQDTSVSPEEARGLWRKWNPPGSAPRAGVRAAALEELAANWSAAGVEVVYVLMPLSGPFRAAFGQDPRLRFDIDLLRSLTARHGGLILNCREAVPDEAFYDSDHLRAGPLRERFSRRLGQAIRTGGACGSIAPPG